MFVTLYLKIVHKGSSHFETTVILICQCPESHWIEQQGQDDTRRELWELPPELPGALRSCKAMTSPVSSPHGEDNHRRTFQKFPDRDHIDYLDNGRVRSRNAVTTDVHR